MHSLKHSTIFESFTFKQRIFSSAEAEDATQEFAHIIPGILASGCVPLLLCNHIGEVWANLLQLMLTKVYARIYNLLLFFFAFLFHLVETRLTLIVIFLRSYRR